MAAGQDEAFVTLATNDTYSLGALVLAHSLRNVGTTRQIVVMISTQVTSSIRQLLLSVFDHVVEVDVLDSSDTQNLALLTRPDLGCTFTKFNCWRLTQFKKCVFLDADTLVLQNVDDLFDREELSAAPDAGWPDCFNSGVFVFVPNEATYAALLQFAIFQGSFDGGDQGLLNLFFNDWSTKDIKKHLPFTYNVVSQAFYSYLPAFKQFRRDVKIVHFIGAVKPWSHKLDTSTGQVTPEAGTGHNVEFLNIWWQFFLSRVQPHLDTSLEYCDTAGLVGELAKLKLDASPAQSSAWAPHANEREWQYAWERGQIDYLGKDSFSQIMGRIDQTMSTPDPSVATSSSTSSTTDVHGERKKSKSPKPVKK